jgi:hypothetical protein
MEESIRKKIEEVSRSLGVYCGGKLYRGVTTGLNKAFVIDAKTRNQLISEDPKCSSIIKPFLVGDDIRRYEINFQNKYLIFTQRGINIEKFSSVKKHLEKFKKELTPKLKLEGEEEIGRKPGDYKWYEIQDTTAYFPEFERPKIIYPDIAITCRLALDERGDHYLGNTGYILPRNDPDVIHHGRTLTWLHYKEQMRRLPDDQLIDHLQQGREHLAHNIDIFLGRLVWQIYQNVRRSPDKFPKGYEEIIFH